MRCVIMTRSIRERSFYFGVAAASLTWIIVLYLNYLLAEVKNYYHPYTMTPKYQDSYKLKEEKYSRLKNFNDILDSLEKKKLSIDKTKKFYPNLKGEKSGKKSIISPLNYNTDSDDAELAQLGMVITIEDQKVRDEGFHLHAFNALISNRLSMNRPIPDTRNKRCKNRKYPSELPTVSVIICFYREHIPTLLRTIHSVLNRSPKHLLKEIILVDDTYDEKYHSEVKASLLDFFDKVKLFNTPRREGLIRARIFGSRKAAAEVLVFLDSHVEVNIQWLEPLLMRISTNRSHVVTPIIDVISPDTFKYSPSPLVSGGFNWGLHFKWDSIPYQYFSDKSNYAKPIKSATMAGGLFAINREYFKHLGEYDDGMDIWGGENLEISFRIWMCGGNLEIIPCSRVGHIFRKRRPYGDTKGGDSLLKNSIRVARVWLDEYKERFFETSSAAAKLPYGDIAERINLRKQLKCKSFKWYLENIYPKALNGTGNIIIDGEVKKFERWDRKKRNYMNEWKIQLRYSNLCIESEEDVNKRSSKFVLAECASVTRQLFYQTDKNELVLAKLLCLEASVKNPRLAKCHEMGGNQEWMIKTETSELYNVATGMCLSAQEKRSGSYVNMFMCSISNLTSWAFVS